MGDGRIMKENMRIIFMGTPEFAVPPLRAMAEGGYDVILAVTQPDRARDRGKKIQPTPVKAAALEYGIEVVQPDRVKNNEEFLGNRVSGGKRRISSSLAAYGKILPKELLELPRLGCVNIHASLLPRASAAPRRFGV